MNYYKNKYKYKYKFIICFIFFTMITFQIPIKAEEYIQKKILIINSYGKELNFDSNVKASNWSDEIISGIASEISCSEQHVNLNVEYMDSDSYSTKEYYEMIYNLYKYKYKNVKFDTIITLDDNAFKFLSQYGDDLFPNTPIVFTGVNEFKESMIKNRPFYTGIAKNPDIKSTLDIALKIHLSTKEIFVVTGKNTTETSTKQLVESLVPLYKDKVKFIFCDDENITTVKGKIDSLPEYSVVFITSRFKDNNGNDISIAEGSRILTANSKTPFYSPWNRYLNNGVVGGMITYGNEYGKSIGKMTLKILNGEKASNISVTDDESHKYTFDYNELKRFNINESLLPEDSLIINSPKSFYFIPKNIMWNFAAGIIVILCLVIIFLLFSMKKCKNIAKRLSNSESLLKTLINSSPDIIFFKDQKGRLLEANNSLLDLLKSKAKTIQKLEDLPHIELHDFILFNEHDKKAWESGTVYRSEENLPYGKDGIIKIYDVIRIPLFNDDKTRRGLVLLGRDITEHKNDEENKKIINELRHYDKVRTEFFSNISHELKTPLHLTFSAVQIIELKLNSNIELNRDNLRKYTKIMKQNSYRLLRIINNIIDISKIDAGYFYVTSENIDIVNVVENITMSVVDYVESKNISIIFDTEMEEKVLVCDPDALERIILNLLSNSIKFTPKGGSIEVNIYDRGDMVAISVKDTGIGIPFEKQASIFERFVQVDKSLSRNMEGSGIGLSLVRSLVELNNGTISLISSPNEGSEFIIELPIKLLAFNESLQKQNLCANANKIERISIEFSDIYN